LNKDIKIALAMFTFSYIVRILDIFVLNSPASSRSIILSKAIPLLVLLYVLKNVEKVGFDYIGLSKRKAGWNLLLGVVLLALTLGYNYVPDTFLFFIYGIPFQNPTFFFDWGIAYYLFFCVVNSLMEEGVFRGFMQKKFYVMGKWNAIIIQAFLFGVWHIVWTFYNLYDFSSHNWIVYRIYVFEYTVGYVFFTFVFGVIMGYAFFKTESLLGPVLCHTFYNFFLTFLLFNESAMAGVIKFVGYPIMGVLSLFVVKIITEKMMEERIRKLNFLLIFS